MRPSARTAPTVAALVVTLLVAVTGCGSSGDAGGSVSNGRGGGGTQGSTSGSGDASPLSFTARTVAGDEFDASRLQGNPVVLWFWAPWCTVCRAEASDVAALADEFDGEVTFVGVPGLGKTDDMQSFVDDTGTGNFQHAVDSDGSLWSRFGVVSQPAYAFVSSDGSVATFTGSLELDDLRRTVEGLVSG